MTTNIARWDAGMAAPRTRTTLDGAWTALKHAWSRYRNRIALVDVDERLLRDLGFEAHRIEAGSPSGWAVEARLRMAGPLFLGR